LRVKDYETRDGMGASRGGGGRGALHYEPRVLRDMCPKKKKIRN